MKAYGFHGVLGLRILIGAIVFCFASTATSLEENVSTSSQPRLPANQPNKTKSKQNTSAALKEKQSKNSQPPESNTQRTNANSRRQVESRRSERRQENVDLITTAAGLVLSALRKPAPDPPPPPPAPVVVKTAPAQQKTTPHKRTKWIDNDDVWSRINPVSK